MHSRSYILTRSGARDGLALLTVLAFIVLLTILLVAFISFTQLNRGSTASYSQAIQAQEIAQGGIQDVLSDLHAEIVAGSLSGGTYTQGTNADAVVYIPTTNLTAEPARIGYANASYGNSNTATLLSPTLIRVSRATGNGGDTFFSSPSSNYVASELPINRASDVPTTNAAANGRTISATRWNKTYLLAATDATIPTPFSNAPPDWVYVTRTGSRVCTTAEWASLVPSNNLTNNYGTLTPGVNPPASPVVGRYAFVIYDEGSLLDLNVAGYVAAATNLASAPTLNNPAGLTEAVYGKSYLAYADLTQIPGFAAANRFSTANQAQVDALVNWRNASAGGGGSLTGANYLDAVFNNAQNGFLTFQTSGASLNDSPLLGRQDLIHYFAYIDPNINTTSATLSQALPYLGTFSRSLNWPSWHPTLDSTNMPGYRSVYQSKPGWTSTYQTNYLANIAPVAYRTQMETVGVANRDLPNVRFASGGTVTHYNDNGTTTQYTVNPGDPLLEHRFSLARLGWFNSVNPVSGPGANAKAIQACFGLKWGADAYGSPCWIYVGSAVDASGNPTGTTAQTGIETLDMVGNSAALNDTNPREPNFFELLKAGILSGSLGKDPGPATGMAQNIPVAYQAPNYQFTLDGVNYQVTDEGPMQVSDDTYFAQKDMHVLQIGANIIDQYDSDSYPTAIYLDAFNEETSSQQDYTKQSSLTPETGPVNVVYGIENLPYFTRFYPLNWVTTQDAQNGTNGMNVWLVPEVWQPFQQPATATNRPTQFCMRAYGQVQASWSEPYQYPPGTGATINAGEVSTTNNYDANPPDAFVYFKDTTGTNFYYSPVPLTVSLDNGTSSINKYPSAAPYMQASGPPASTAQEFMGFHVGWMPYNLTTTPNTNDVSQAFAYPPNGSLYNMGAYTIPSPLVTFCLQYTPDGGTTYLPYAYWARHGVAHFNGGSSSTNTVVGGNVPVPTTDPGWGGWGWGGYVTWRADALTDRFSCSGSDEYGGGPSSLPVQRGAITNPNTYQDTLNNPPAGFFMCHNFPNRSAGFFYHAEGPETAGYDTAETGNDKVGFLWPSPTGSTANDTGGAAAFVGCWAENEPQQPWNSWTLDAFYADDDGVVRPGNDVARNLATADGCSMIFGASSKTDPSQYGTSASTSVGRRPLVLNRAFRSVGELGYTYRDLPFKTLDFFSTYSADSALLDLFSLTDEPEIVAGQVDLNNAPTPVIQAMLSGGNKEELDSTYNISSEVANLAKGIATQLNPTGASPNPLQNRADLVGELGLSFNTNSGVVSGPIYNGFSAAADRADKAYLEAPVRALAGMTNTRTWNLLIDIIAQSGHLVPTATNLSDFVVKGEKRYWLHIAIDRYTGKIIDQQLEPVYE